MSTENADESVPIISKPNQPKHEKPSIILMIYAIYILLIVSGNSVMSFTNRSFINVAMPAIQKEMDVRRLSTDQV